MPFIQFGLDGEVVSEDYSGTVGDPSKEVLYTDQQKIAAAANVPLAIAKVSPQQNQIDKQVAHINFLEGKANAIRGYDKDQKPLYVETPADREKLLKIAGMERNNLTLSAQLAEMSLGEDALNKHNEDISLEQQLADHARTEQRAREILAERQAQELADRFAGNIKASHGSGLKIK